MFKLLNELLVKLGLKKAPNLNNHTDYEELDRRNDAIRSIYEQNRPKQKVYDTGEIFCCKCGKEQGPDDDFTFDVDKEGFLCDECWRNEE